MKTRRSCQKYARQTCARLCFTKQACSLPQVRATRYFCVVLNKTAKQITENRHDLQIRQRTAEQTRSISK